MIFGGFDVLANEISQIEFKLNNHLKSNFTIISKLVESLMIMSFFMRFILSALSG